MLRPSPGFISGKRCVAKKPKGKSAKRCTIRTIMGLAGAPSGVAGANSFAFNGTAAGKRLKPGNYELSAAPIAPLQTHGTGDSTVKFTIKR